MSKIVQRGYIPEDKDQFGNVSLIKLKKASEELLYLLNRGYSVKGASTFIGNHYLLSERQRLALARSIATNEAVEKRKAKEICEDFQNQVINIDGFNTIITLEVALSDSLILKGMDGTYRDLAGLRGTYRIIDKTEKALRLIGEKLEEHKIEKACFYLDSPVSNSGSLKVRILELLEEYNFELEVKIITNVDSTLEALDNVITSDAIILDKCKSWINLNKEIIEKKIDNSMIVDFEKCTII